MWRAVALKILYYLFFFIIFFISMLIFLKLTDFYFNLPLLENFLDSFISRIEF